MDVLLLLRFDVLTIEYANMTVTIMKNAGIQCDHILTLSL